MNWTSISPLLRGFFRRKNSDVGPFVRFSLNAQDRRARRISSIDISSDDFSDNFSGDFSFPTILHISGLGTFYIAETYEEALRMSREGSDPERNQGAEHKAGHGTGRMKGRVCLITGGAQGFGEELVRHLHSEGAFTYIADINFTKARLLEKELNEEGISSRAVEVDVADEESVREAAEYVTRESGGLDLLVNNAGVIRVGSVTTLSRDDFDFVTNINYTAYFLMVKHFSPIMALQNRAKGDYFTDIIQINSKSGLTGSNRNGAYAGSKFGGIGLTQSFALELINDNIKVNAICPGNFFDGPMWSDPEKGLFKKYLKEGKVSGALDTNDVRKFYEAKIPMNRGCRGIDVARAMYYAVEQKYETGQAIPVTGGQFMMN